MVVCLVSLGANLGERGQTLDEAVAQLGANRVVHGLVESPRLETKAIGGPSDQPAFLNSVVRFLTDAEPLGLLAILQAIEHNSQRARHKRWAARTLDLDLLAYGDQVLREPTLRVPHPRMSYRPFVLEPAVAVAPDWRHPELGVTLAELLNTLRHGRHAIGLVGGSHADRMAIGHLLRAEFSSERGLVIEQGVIEQKKSHCQSPARLTIDLNRDPSAFQGVRGPRLRLADCLPEHWRDEVRAAMGCVWPGLTG